MKIILVLLITWLVWTNVVSAGECLEPLDYYILTADFPDSTIDAEGFTRIFYCLSIHLMHINTSNDLFMANPIWYYEYNDSCKKEAYGRLELYLDFGDSDLKCKAIKALAYFGWPKSYEYLKTCEIDQEIVSLYVLNNIRDAVPLIVERYKKVEKLYRTKPQFSFYDKFNCLGALYQLGGPDILPFLDEIITNPKPEKIKPLAEKVRSRILEKYPNYNESLNSQ